MVLREKKDSDSGERFALRWKKIFWNQNERTMDFEGVCLKEHSLARGWTDFERSTNPQKNVFYETFFAL